MINRTHIDHMILDNEGPEYQLIPMIAIDNVFADENIAICHMNVEFHAPGPKSRYEEFVEVMQGVLRVGRFAPIHNEKSHNVFPHSETVLRGKYPGAILLYLSMDIGCNHPMP
ncbi:hypothetical protein OSTOST_17968 [Ostertagia ostertagi]